MSIEVKNLHYTYFPKAPNKKHALNGLNFTIEQGSFVAFVGETGSGKSTLMQCFNHLLIPTEGTINIDGIEIRPKKKDRKINKSLRRKVGLVFQFPEYQLFDETVLKDVSFGPKNFGIKEPELSERVRKALDIMGIDESFNNRSPFEISGGEKKRVAIAGVLASDPDIIVFDEPTVGMDPKRKKVIVDLLTRLHGEGKTIILVSHDMELVLRCAQKVFVLSQGNLVFEGTPNELFSQDDNYGLEAPKAFKFAKKLKNSGVNISLNNVFDIDTLVEEIKRAKNG